jgi:hypothetical protein
MITIYRKLFAGLGYGLFAIVVMSALVACDGNGVTDTSKPRARTPAISSQAATTNPAVEAEAISTDWIKLKWKNLGAGMSYEVYRGAAPNFEPTYNSLVSPPGLSEPSFDDVRLDPGTTYYYKLYGRSFGSTGPATHIGDISATTPTKD